MKYKYSIYITHIHKHTHTHKIAPKLTFKLKNLKEKS